MDMVDYSGRGGPLLVDFYSVGLDGEPGENDIVRPDIEVVEGGSGNDKFTAHLAGVTLRGNRGDDTLQGSVGDDIWAAAPARTPSPAAAATTAVTGGPATTPSPAATETTPSRLATARRTRWSAARAPTPCRRTPST